MKKFFTLIAIASIAVVGSALATQASSAFH